MKDDNRIVPGGELGLEKGTLDNVLAGTEAKHVHRRSARRDHAGNGTRPVLLGACRGTDATLRRDQAQGRGWLLHRLSGCRLVRAELRACRSRSAHRSDGESRASGRIGQTPHRMEGRLPEILRDP